MSFQDEYNRLFSNGCKVSGRDWNKSRYFDPSDACYSGEAALVSSLTSEAYSNYGLKVNYYIKKISTKRDKLLGEDPLEWIVRRFKLDMWTETVPSLQKSYQLQGMLYEEYIHLYCTITHFHEASQYDENRTKILFPEYTPKIGDLMQFTYNNIFYEVVNVKDYGQNSTFLAVPITYEFIVRQWKNDHEDVEDPTLPIADVTNLGKIFNLGEEKVTPECDILNANTTVQSEKQTGDNHPELVIEQENHVNTPDSMLDF